MRKRDRSEMHEIRNSRQACPPRSALFAARPFFVLAALLFCPETTLCWTVERRKYEWRTILPGEVPSVRQDPHMSRWKGSRAFRTAAPIRAYIEDDDFGVVGTADRNQSDDDASLSSPQNDTDETSRDYTGAGTLGDIMSSTSNATTATTSFSGLVTTEGGLLQESFGVVSPLDRMALTANGNLQRLFSSYYDSPVHVVVDQCSQRHSVNGQTNDLEQSQQWDRIVHLTVHNQTFCTAKSNITVHDPACQSLVASGKVGLGQLFRYLDKLPNFALLEAGYSEQTGGLWRIYQLTCNEVSCLIREDFAPNAWEIKSP